MKALLIIFFFISASTFAQDTTKAIVKEEMMKKYFMVFLYRGDAWTPEKTAAVIEIQRGHLENISRLAKLGKIVLAGPFMDDNPLRGIFIFDAASVQEVEELCSTDPAIIAKRLKIEVRPWYGPKALHKVNEEYFKE